jgi:hypothetical protein
MDIVLAKNGICTLIDVVIIDPMQTDLFPWFYATQRFATFDAIQAKERSYHDRHSTDQFLLLAIEIFGCLYKQVDVFLHEYVNAIWSLKAPKGLLLSILVTFLHQKIALQRMQASSILSWAVVIGLATSWLSPLQDTPPITIAGLLQVVDFWHGKIKLTYSKWSILTWRKFWNLVWTHLTSCKILYTFSKSKVYLFCTIFKFKLYSLKK